ncbi:MULTISPECIES: hypothetical protein [unclassified Fredinandcohnia]|uniref:hypothetical protein n=1 Tax=unclassified Fredinandcohnia TaxID=2837514 RepID=UPI0030FD4D52
MIVVASYKQLKDAQNAIENLNKTKPTIYKKFINIIKLTRRMQYGYQYMGSLIMGEIQPMSSEDYVASVYQREVEKLRADAKFNELREMLNTHKQLSYVNISKLALGENPTALVGPSSIRS